MNEEDEMQIQPTMPAMVTTGGNDGLGGGLGLLALAMLGGRGFGNDWNRGNGNWGGGEGCVTPSNLSAQLANVTDTQMNTTVLQSLGDIKASVPLAEGQVQLALAGAQADINANVFNASQSINANIATGLQTAIQGQSAIRKDVSEAIASSLASQSVIKETVLTSAAANLQATLNSKFELAQVINSDGEKTRALISSIENANTQRLLGERQDLINELQAEGRRRDDRHGIEINMTNQQNQTQLQFQQQAQVLSALSSALCEVGQIARATNSNVIVGNTGATTTGTQTANPTNVRA